MSEKVLGFKEKDAVKHTDFTHGEILEYWVKKDDVVPVVTVEWLKKYCKEHEKSRSQFPNTAFIWVDDLLEAVRLQAKEGGKEK